MKRHIIFLVLILLFCYLCVPYFCVDAAISVSVDPAFDENKKPVGFPTHTFDFDVEITITAPVQYYTINVELTSSTFKGIAANAGDSLENDLYFDALDNSGWKWVNSTTLQYKYTSTSTTLPSSIKVRCRDWGAHGEIKVTVSEDTDVDITRHIP